MSIPQGYIQVLNFLLASMKSLVFRKATKRSRDLNNLSQNTIFLEIIGCIMQIELLCKFGIYAGYANYAKLSKQ